MFTRSAPLNIWVYEVLESLFMFIISLRLKVRPGLSARATHRTTFARLREQPQCCQESSYLV
jgi:hypothetical protein